MASTLAPTYATISHAPLLARARPVALRRSTTALCWLSLARIQDSRCLVGKAAALTPTNGAVHNVNIGASGATIKSLFPICRIGARDRALSACYAKGIRTT